VRPLHGVPLQVPDVVVAELKSREGADGLIRLPKPRTVRPGDPVKIPNGPFAGLFQSMKPHERVEILLGILGGCQRITLPRGDVAISC
jgi:hypothetical protein